MPQQRSLQSAEAEEHNAPEVEELAEVGVAVPQPPQPEAQARNTLIYRQGSGKGAPCTEGGGGGLIFVLSPPPARGKTSSLQSHQTNEPGTSPK